MPHYFTNEPQKDSKEFEIHYTFEGQSFTLKSVSGVFSNQRLDGGTNLFIKTLLNEPLHGRFLDLGCGYGPVGLTLATLRPSLLVTLSDINLAAVSCSEKNAKALGLKKSIILASDGYQNIDGTFQTIALNPPISAGKTTMYRLYRESAEHLDQGGTFYVVIRKDKGAASTVLELKKSFSAVTLIARDHGYHVYRAQQ